MSNLIQLEMTLDEARETDRLIKRHINTTRYLLLDMRDRKGWKALGYESFGDYGKKSLGYEKAYLTQLADAGEISLQLGYDSEFAIANSIPPESQLRPLKAVPEEERKAIWEEATRKAEEENAKLTAKRVDDAVAEWRQRNKDWHQNYLGEKKKFEEAQEQLMLVRESKTKPVIKKVIPDDYEDAKAQAAQLATVKADLDKLKKEQTKIIDQQVKAKLQGYQSEVDKLEEKKKTIEEIVDRKKAYLDSLDSEVKRIEVHQITIEESRLNLISLASFLNDLDPISDKATIKKWLALAGMLDDASQGIRSVFAPQPQSGHRNLQVVS